MFDSILIAEIKEWLALDDETLRDCGLNRASLLAQLEDLEK